MCFTCQLVRGRRGLGALSSECATETRFVPAFDEKHSPPPATFQGGGIFLDFFLESTILTLAGCAFSSNTELSTRSHPPGNDLYIIEGGTLVILSACPGGTFNAGSGTVDCNGCDSAYPADLLSGSCSACPVPAPYSCCGATASTQCSDALAGNCSAAELAVCPAPTASPTATPQPTALPTPQPTPQPSVQPSALPTALPTATAQPAPLPTEQPMPLPTAPTPKPTPVPTKEPTPLPPAQPTAQSTARPTTTAEPLSSAALPIWALVLIGLFFGLCFLLVLAHVARMCLNKASFSAAQVEMTGSKFHTLLLQRSSGTTKIERLLSDVAEDSASDDIYNEALTLTSEDTSQVAPDVLDWMDTNLARCLEKAALSECAESLFSAGVHDMRELWELVELLSEEELKDKVGLSLLNARKVINLVRAVVGAEAASISAKTAHSGNPLLEPLWTLNQEEEEEEEEEEAL